MNYRVKVSLPTLREGYQYVINNLPLITDPSKAIGPLVSISNIKADQFFDFMPLLSNVEDYALNLYGQDMDVLFENNDLFIKPNLFERLNVFFHPYGSLVLNINNPNLSSPEIKIDFYASFDPTKRALPPKTFFTDDERVTIMGEILSWLLSDRGVAAPAARTEELARRLIFEKLDDYPEEETTGFRFGSRHRDSTDINLSVNIRHPGLNPEQMARLFFRLVPRIEKPLGWCADFYGDKDRVQKIFSQLKHEIAFMEYGCVSTLIRSHMLKQFIEDNEQWCKEQRKSIVSDDSMSKLLTMLESEKYKNLYPNVGIIWTNIRSWIIDAEGHLCEPSTELYGDKDIWLGATKKGKGELLFAIGDTLPQKKIVSAIEKKLNVKLKKYYFG